MEDSKNVLRALFRAAAGGKRTRHLAVVFSLFPILAMADTEEAENPPIDLPSVRVQGEAESGSLSVTDVEQARKELHGIPGGVSLVDETQLREGLTSDMAEVLSGVPGVFIRSRFGGDEVRMSIRGSGITQTFGIRGVRVLRDGMPVSGAGGFTNPELVDFASARFAEVYRGANALQFGGADLGGAINFVSHTGYSAPRLKARLELGSNEYIRPQVSGGGRFNRNSDGFVSVSGIHQDGFRGNSEQDTVRAYGNLGHRW
ncbi:MAG: TonB-dependent receptor plug domain-containing protein, partial [Wenzhouxiangellaceae bacterium]